jgi:hypothetical protein
MKKVVGNSHETIWTDLLPWKERLREGIDCNDLSNDYRAVNSLVNGARLACVGLRCQPRGTRRHVPVLQQRLRVSNGLSISPAGVRQGNGDGLVGRLRSEPEADRKPHACSVGQLRGGCRPVPGIRSSPRGTAERYRGVIFFGPPGTGKTAACRALAKELGWTFLPVTGSDLASDARALDHLLARARELRPAIVFIDEADELLRHREYSATTAATNKLLSLIDGARHP